MTVLHLHAQRDTGSNYANRSRAVSVSVVDYSITCFLRAFSIVIMLMVSLVSRAQKPIEMKNLWTRPEVHVVFQGYTISYSVKDVNKAIQLLEETGDKTYGPFSKLDTGKDYYIELLPGQHQEYHNSLQPLIQDGVGAFLLTAGHALIVNSKNKIRTHIIEDIGTGPIGEKHVVARFYDEKNHNLIFFGHMNTGMYGKDLGLDLE